MFSDHKAMSLEINYEKKKAVKKNTNTWRLNNMLLNNHWVTEEIKEKSSKYLEEDANKNRTIQNLWISVLKNMENK